MSELYSGHKALESYFKEKGNLASYYGFLLLHHNTIVASSLPINNWKELNNHWVNHFLMEAKYQIINEESLISIKEKTSKWIVNIEQVTLKDLKEFIFALYQFPELQKDIATLAFSYNDEKYSPKICKLYKLSEDSDPTLSVFPPFTCGYVKLNDEKSQVIIKHLITELNFCFKAIPIGNEASKSQYVCSYLVAIANLFEDKFKVYSEKNVSGMNGHGPVDFALIQIQNSRIIGITEVKDKDFQQGVAQNAVQCESALSNKKKNVFGIITDSEKWFFLE
ncbi:unnamed protein product [Rhizophagus irregularis]|nr:unnamed protein product [Rhizophagus irregularis]